MNSENNYTYDAFISYRHTEPDKTIAEKLHRMLETYKIPKSIRKLTGKSRIQRVFRDRDELPTSSNLADNIQRALETSNYLIVICSPRTPKSQWVIKEIETFSALHGHDKILALLIEGEPQDAFPEQLRFVRRHNTLPDGTTTESLVEIEPLAADIRGTNIKEMQKILKTEILRLLAPILNCRYDDLRQRHRERMIKTILTASISLSAFFLTFGSFSTYQALLINQKSQEVMQKSREIEQKNQEVMAQIEKTQISQSRYLADISNQLYKEGDRYRAILTALEALPKDLNAPERPYIPEAEYALCQALHVYDADDTMDMDIVLDHAKNVIFIEMSPDGKTLLTVSDDGLLHTWDAENGKKLASVEIGDDVLTGFQAFFLDDTRIITLVKGLASCLDIHGSIQWQYNDKAYKIALSTDRRLLACDFFNSIGILDASTGELLADMISKKEMPLGGPGIYISRMTFSKSSELLALAASDGTICLVNAESGELVDTRKTAYPNISSLEFTKDLKLMTTSFDFDEEDLVFGKGMGRLEVFPSSGKKPQLSTDFPDAKIEKAAIHPHNSSWVVLTSGEKLHIVDLENGEILYTFLHGDRVTAYKIFDTFILSASKDGTVRFLMTQGSGYEYEYSRITFQSSIDGMVQGKGRLAVYYPQSTKVYLMKYLENEKILKLEGHNDYVANGCFSGDGHIAATFGMDSANISETGVICLWDTKTKTLITKKALGESVEEIRFIDNDRKLLVQLLSDTLLILDASDLSTLFEYHADNLIRSTVFNKEQTYAAVITYYDVTVLSLSDLSVIRTFDIYADAAALSGNRILLTLKSGLQLYDIPTGGLVLEHENEGISICAMDAEGKHIALAYKDKTVKIFNADTALTELHTLHKNGLQTSMLAFSPDGQILIVGYEDTGITFFDVRTGNLLNSLGRDYLSSPPDKVLFSTDGTRFACLDNGGDGLIFDSGSLKLLAKASMLDIDPDFSLILARYDQFVLMMPVYSTQMLLDEAVRQLDGRTLTPEERKLFFIE